MKTMTCNQLGGACDVAFKADSFDKIAKLSQQHGKDMFEKQDAAHLKAMDDMRALMQKPEAMAHWFAARHAEFDALPEDE